MPIGRAEETPKDEANVSASNVFSYVAVWFGNVPALPTASGRHGEPNGLPGAYILDRYICHMYPDHRDCIEK